MGRKHSSRNKTLDRIYLITVAVVFFIIFTAFNSMLYFHFELPMPWLMFVLFVILYNGVTAYGATRAKVMKNYVPQWKLMLLLLSLTETPLVVIFILFLLKILPLPTEVWNYAIVAFILLPLTFVGFEELSRRLAKKGHISKLKDQKTDLL